MIRKKRAYDEIYLWPVFSVYVRLRDIIPGTQGYCRCITCGRMRKWNEGDAGHGISRGKLAVKYNEKNVHFQCKNCNKWKNGDPINYKIEMNKRYGPNTWDLLVHAGNQMCKMQKFEWDILIDLYSMKVRELKAKHHIK